MRSDVAQREKLPSPTSSHREEARPRLHTNELRASAIDESAQGMQEGTARHGRSNKEEFVEKEAWIDEIERFVRTVPASRRKKARKTLLGFARGPEKHPDLAVRKHPDQVTKDDLEKFFEQLKQHHRDWTIHDYKLILKQLFKKRKGKRFVPWIKIPRNIRSRLGPEDLLR